MQLDFFERIKNSDNKAFEALFKEYYKFLCSYAYGLTKEKHAAEEIVEEFFVELWKNREKLTITTSVRSYFIGSVHNRCINYLQRVKPRFISSSDITQLIDNVGTIGDRLVASETPSLLTRELENILADAIEKLPKSCKEVFVLSRFKELSYNEIAQKLNVSVNTVKTQIKIALSKLREDLKEYLTILLLFVLK